MATVTATAKRVKGEQEYPAKFVWLSRPKVVPTTERDERGRGEARITAQVPLPHVNFPSTVYVDLIATHFLWFEESSG